ncbi:universal stress protein [Salinilacihabitans rarus]|uniref:universal stress protein n=1 Tax=Salinilacihabitans rarus TaxID=2961596 RepID=UPI0020C9056C|nr:universal stress protein [Salinilacihabitans rarus]
MTLLAPFDGTALSRAALERAAEFADLTDDDVLALTVVPDDRDYAVERGWIPEDVSFDPERVAAAMESQVHDIAPEAAFRSEIVDSDEPTATATTNVVREIRRVAAAVDAAVVFVGTENAGGVTAPLSSVGAPVVHDPSYDVYIVRHAD